MGEEMFVIVPNLAVALLFLKKLSSREYFPKLQLVLEGRSLYRLLREGIYLLKYLLLVSALFKSDYLSKDIFQPCRRYGGVRELVH